MTGADGPVTVRVEPAGILLDVRPDETVMAAAVRQGYSWPTICGGQGTCKVCVLEVQEGGDRLSPMARGEEGELRQTFGGLERRGRPLRLACQARPVAGEVVVFKRGVRKLGDGGGAPPG